MSKVKHVLAMFAAVSVFLLAGRADASHFRYGNITYTIVDPVNAPTTVRFVVTMGWRSTFIDCSSLKFGDGVTNACTVGFQIGSGSDAAGLQHVVNQYAVTHTYPSVGQYVASFDSCCRLSTLANAPDSNFRVEAKVDLTAGNTGNPVAAVPAIIQLQTGGVRTIDIGATDPDGTPIACRFATQAESSTTNIPPTVNGHVMSIAVNANPPGCKITWDTNGGVAGAQYAVQVVLEAANGVPKNTAVLDFLVELVSSPPPKCVGSGLFTVDQGQPFSTTVVGTNQSGGLTLTMNNIGLAGAITPVPGTVGNSPMNATFVALGGAPGAYVQTVTFTDQLNVSGFCTISMAVPQCPSFGQPCAAGTGQCQAAGYLICLGPSVVCNAVTNPPTAELCDGLDNDCDGVSDNGNPESGVVCSTGIPGLCGTGISDCPAGAGALSCTPDFQPGDFAETCNGVDDNCDGLTDEGFNAGAVCVVGIGACQTSGSVICDGVGGTKCSAVAGNNTAETCNAIDDDCDGTADEDFPVGMTCTSGLGACAVGGVYVCDANGDYACDGVAGAPGVEACGNQADEDCDGALDNGCLDGDNDGVFDEVEVAIGTDPADPDSDDDGVADGAEPAYASDSDADGLINALDADSDNDGLYDGTELGFGCSGPGTDQAAGHCLPDADAGATTSNPIDADTDSSGASDGSEDANLNGMIDAGESDPSTGGDDGTVADADGDGLGDALELFLGSNPTDVDSDDDGLADGDEANPADDVDGDGVAGVLDPDSDNDALFDGTELGASCASPDTSLAVGNCVADLDEGATKTSPLVWDTDGGGKSDGSEDPNLDGAIDAGETDPNDPADDAFIPDSDGDGLGDLLEVSLGSKAGDSDTDNDGLLDGLESNPSADTDGDTKKNISDWDSDEDGLFDGTEAGFACDDTGTDVAAGHCIPDADMGATKTSGILADTDGGTAKDGDEDVNHDGAVDAGERNPLDPQDDIVAAGCVSDEDCGDATSGQVCDIAAGACAPGCHVGGNGCPEGQTCTSIDDSIGECKPTTTPPVVTPDPEVTEDSGCGCRTAGSDAGTSGGLWAGALAALAIAARRRRAGRSATHR